MTHTIPVTAADIANGIRGGCSLCPIALALQRHFVVLPPAVVVMHFIAVVGTTKYELPPSVSEFITNFDAGRDVEPFSFQLESQ